MSGVLGHYLFLNAFNFNQITKKTKRPSTQQIKDKTEIEMSENVYINITYLLLCNKLSGLKRTHIYYLMVSMTQESDNNLSGTLFRSHLRLRVF